MEKTSVDWLINNLTKHFVIKGNSEMLNKIIEQAKQMEHEQHQETFKQSRLAKVFEKDMPPVWESWEQYYNETFKK